ncbi:aminoacyl-tRNA hydrolase [soil metagenome]
MWIIAGLGNPGARYQGTPHNLGFAVALKLAERHGLRWKSSNLAQAEMADGAIAGVDVKLVMPTTYMNLSGEAVGPIMRYYKVNPAHVLAVSDDVAIPWGRLRLRDGGSHGGHNGLRSMIDHLGTDRFPRLRVGCEAEGWPGALKDYVLCQLRGDALELAMHMVEICADAAEEALKNGVHKAQNKYNAYDAGGNK